VLLTYYLCEEYAIFISEYLKEKITLSIWQNTDVETNINSSQHSFFWSFGSENLATLHARARIIQGYEIALDNGRSHCSIADQPTPTSPGFGPTPLELCVMSHAGCYATIAALTAQKMRLQLKGCEVKVEAVKSQETGTIAQETFDILFNLDAPEDRVQRLHELTLKNCPVGILFEKAGVDIKYNLKTQKE
jgi:putative redox protein